MRRIILLSMLVFGAAALASTVGTARAGLLPPSCGSTSQVFAPWSDLSDYYFAPNGGFESGASGWSLAGGASVVPGGDPFSLSGSGSRSAQLGAGSTASIDVCYGVTYPAIRFVAAGVGGPATIHVRVAARSLLGVLSILDGGTFTVDAGWDATPKLSTLLSAVAAPFGTSSMQIRISVDSGTALVDDLYVDPFLTKS